GRKSPGGELRDRDIRLVAELDRGVDILAFVGPELDRRKSQRGGRFDPVQKWQLLPPHFHVDGKLRVRSLAQRGVVVGRAGGAGGIQKRRAGQYGGRFQKCASWNGHGGGSQAGCNEQERSM